MAASSSIKAYSDIKEEITNTYFLCSKKGEDFMSKLVTSPLTSIKQWHQAQKMQLAKENKDK